MSPLDDFDKIIAQANCIVHPEKVVDEIEKLQQQNTKLFASLDEVTLTLTSTENAASIIQQCLDLERDENKKLTTQLAEINAVLSGCGFSIETDDRGMKYIKIPGALHYPVTVVHAL